MGQFVLFTDLESRTLASIKTLGNKLFFAATMNGTAPDGAVLLFADYDRCRENLCRWRSNPKTSLKPAFVGLLKGKPDRAQDWLLAADYLSEITLLPWSSFDLMVSQITWKVDKLSISPKHLETPAARLIAYAATRELKMFNATPSPSSKYGFRWMAASLFSDIKTEGEERLLLEQLVAQGVLKKIDRDKLSICPKCAGVSHNIRKACTSCGSTSILSEDVIHHYPCGGVFIEQDGMRDDGVWCTKCKKKLIHIGVDFDRPASIDKCAACGDTAEAFPVQAICLTCNSKFSLGETSEMVIHDYELVDMDFRRIRVKLLGNEFEAVIDPASFKVVLRSEQKLAERYGREFNLLKIACNGLSSAEFNQVLIPKVVKQLRKSDIATKVSDTEFLILLREASKDHSESVVKRLEEHLSSYKTNIKIDGNLLPEVKTLVKQPA